MVSKGSREIPRRKLTRGISHITGQKVIRTKKISKRALSGKSSRRDEKPQQGFHHQNKSVSQRVREGYQWEGVADALQQKETHLQLQTDERGKKS